MIDVKNLSKSFGDHLVLDDITESIQVGEKVVIIGPSGSGKSTFLRCLNLLETPTKGTITFNGTEITDPKAKIDQIRQQMGDIRNIPDCLNGVFPCAKLLNPRK